jgi:hypothetical protein
LFGTDVGVVLVTGADCAWCPQPAKIKASAAPAARNRITTDDARSRVAAATSAVGAALSVRREAGMPWNVAAADHVLQQRSKRVSRSSAI